MNSPDPFLLPRKYFEVLPFQANDGALLGFGRGLNSVECLGSLSCRPTEAHCCALFAQITDLECGHSPHRDLLGNTGSRPLSSAARQMPLITTHSARRGQCAALPPTQGSLLSHSRARLHGMLSPSLSRSRSVLATLEGCSMYARYHCLVAAALWAGPAGGGRGGGRRPTPSATAPPDTRLRH